MAQTCPWAGGSTCTTITKDTSMHPSAKKIAIMQAAAQLFAARGYDVVTVRDIASVMDMTPASLYYYFPDKENLYRQTLLMVFMGGKTAFQHIAGETEIQKIESLIRNIVIYCFTNPIFSRLLLRELNEGQEERLRFLADNVFAALRCKTREILSSYGIQDANDIAECIESSLQGYLQLYRISRFFEDYQKRPLNIESITGQISSFVRQRLRS